jgi:N,N'-diacetyllegionaminate synthase
VIKLIAEIGWNHLGDLNLAERMISEAARCGADYAKFQTWSESRLNPGPWDKDGRRKLYKKAQLSKKDHIRLKKACNRNRINFLTSCFCVDDLSFIRELTNEVKIPSHEATNIELIEQAVTQFDHVYLSLGATKKSEWEQYKKLDKNNKLTVLHCVSVYPLEPERTNLGKFIDLDEEFTSVGYSGHVPNIWDAVVAITCGAKVVEKHFTLDRNLPGRDNKFSILPDDLKRLNEYRHEFPKYADAYLGPDYLPEEQEIRDVYKGRWNKRSYQGQK